MNSKRIYIFSGFNVVLLTVSKFPFVDPLTHLRRGAYAVAVNGSNAYVVSRWCKTCVVMVNVPSPEEMKVPVGGRLQQEGAAEGSLYVVVETLDEVVAATHVGRLGFLFPIGFFSFCICELMHSWYGYCVDERHRPPLASAVGTPVNLPRRGGPMRHPISIHPLRKGLCERVL